MGPPRLLTGGWFVFLLTVLEREGLFLQGDPEGSCLEGCMLPPQKFLPPLLTMAGSLAAGGDPRHWEGSQMMLEGEKQPDPVPRAQTSRALLGVSMQHEEHGVQNRTDFLENPGSASYSQGLWMSDRLCPLAPL